MKLSWWIGCGLTLLGIAANAQNAAWQNAYDSAANAASKGDWTKAQSLFEEAMKTRSDDSPNATRVDVAPGLSQVWRGGAPYMPRWGAGYSAYKAAMASSDESVKKADLETAVKYLEALREKKFDSPYIAYYLTKSYEALGQTGKTYAPVQGGNQAIDLSFVTNEDKGVLKLPPVPKPEPPKPKPKPEPKTTPKDENGNSVPVGAYIPVKPKPKVDTPKVDQPAPEKKPVDVAGLPPRVDPNRPKAQKGPRIIKNPDGSTVIIDDPGTTPNDPNSFNAGGLTVNPKKYALIIGNGNYSFGALDYAANDTKLLADALRASAGYGESNVTTLINGTKEEMLNTVKSLSTTLPQGAIVFVYFTGQGALNLSDNKDYLFGVDAGSLKDFSNALTKEDLLGPLSDKATRVMSVWQVSRPAAIVGEMKKGFGAQDPGLSSIAIWNACALDQKCLSIDDGTGKNVGLFTSQLVKELSDARSNYLKLEDVASRVSTDVSSKASSLGGSVKQTPPVPKFLGILDEDAWF